MKLLYLLVKYGYYANMGDINDLMRPLLSLLKDDQPRCGETDEKSEEIMQVLLEID